MPKTRTTPSLRDQGTVIARIEDHLDDYLREKQEDENLSRSEVTRLALTSVMLIDRLLDSAVNRKAAARAVGGAAELDQYRTEWRAELAETWAKLFPGSHEAFASLFPSFVVTEVER